MNRQMLSSQNTRRSFRHLAVAVGLASLGAFASADTTVKLKMPVSDLVKNATLVGHMPNNMLLRMSISLTPPNPQAFQDYANAVSNPRSPLYHQFLSPTQIGDKFGASAATVNATVNYLKSKGMKIELIAQNRLAILFHGTVLQAESAFGAKVNHYRVANRVDKGPKDFFYYSVTPTLPSKVAAPVKALGGLQNAYQPQKYTTLNPTQSRALYNSAALYAGMNGNPGRKGKGINIGVTSHDGYRISNAVLFGQTFGLPAPVGGYGSNITKILVNNPDGSTSDGETLQAEGETDLDMQMILTTAPLCNLYIYDGVSFTDPNFVEEDYTRTLTKIADDDIVDVISDSTYNTIDAGTVSTLEANHDQFVAMTIEGITYLSASGDFGTNALSDGSTDPSQRPGFGVTYPEADPEVLVVGGTVAQINGSGVRTAEDGWVGSGSGWSTYPLSFNTLPDWQVGSTVPNGINHRMIPDLALHASGVNLSFFDPTYGAGPTDFAYLIFVDGSETASSGTSASSPLLAGQLGIILEDLTASGAGDTAPNGRTRFGRISDFLYALDGDPTVFYDVLTGDTGVLPNGQEARGRSGWDFVTGWGAPQTDGLLAAVVAGGNNSVLSNPDNTDLLRVAGNMSGLGTAVQGDQVDGDGVVTSLTATDGQVYSVQSVKQSGVGQVAATTVDVQLQTLKARRSASANVSIIAPKLTTGYVYLKNFTASATAALSGKPAVYDLVKTITGSGSTDKINVRLSADYISEDKVQVLVRAIKPSRLGSTSFRLSIDQVTVTEKVAKN